MKTEVKLRVVDEDNVCQSSFVLTFPVEGHLDAFVTFMLNTALNSFQATLTPELVTYDVFINGVAVQKSK